MMIGTIAKMRSLTRCRIKSYKGKAGRRQPRNTTKLRSRQHYAIRMGIGGGKLEEESGSGVLFQNECTLSVFSLSISRMISATLA